MREDQDRERRRAVRAMSRGRVMIHGDGRGRGKIRDLSASGVRFRLAGPLAGYRPGDRVDLELRFDGATGDWWRLAGTIVRIDRESEISVAFDEVPTELAARVRVMAIAAPELPAPALRLEHPDVKVMRLKEVAR